MIPRSARKQPSKNEEASISSRVDAAISGRRWISFAIFAGAFLLKLTFVLQSNETVLVQVPLMDSKYYLDMAEEIAAGGFFRDEAFFMGPLYPYWMALVLVILGKNLLVLQLIQIVGGSVTVLLTFLLGRRFFRPSLGLLAALLLALYGTITFYEGQFLMTWMGTLLNLSALFVLTGEHDRRALKPFALGGVLLGLSALARANILLFVPVVLLWAYFIAGGPRRLHRAGLLLLGVLLPVSLATMHNYAVSRDFILITSNGGVNYYIGNGERATGVFAPLEEIDFEGDTTTEKHVEKMVGRDLKPSEVSRYWFERAFAAIRGDPGRWLGLQLEKIGIFFNGYEVPQIESYDLAREKFVGLRVLFVEFWPLLCLGLIGLVWCLPAWRRYALLYGYIVTYSLSIILFFVTARYRVQIVPVLSLFAAFALFKFVASARSRSPRALYPVMAMTLLLVLTRPSLTAFESEDVLWTDHVHQSRRLSLAGRYSEALEEIDRAVVLHPDSPDSYIYRAIILKDSGNLESAVRDYRAAIDLHYENPSTHYDLGQTLRELGRFDEAVVAYKNAIELDSLKVEAYNNLAVTYRLMRDYENAAVNLRAALRLDPTHIKGYNNLGAVLAESGRTAEARAVLSEAIRRAPDYDLSYKNLAMVYFQEEKWATGLGSLKEYLKRRPDDESARTLYLEVRTILQAGFASEEEAGESGGEAEERRSVEKD